METTIGSEKKTRLAAAEGLSRYKLSLLEGMSQREAAQEVGIPRETLLYWEKRTSRINLSQATIDFFESPDGIIFLEVLVNALQFVMTQVGACGIRLVSMVLQMSSLDYFVGSSYETLRERGIKMEEAIVDFGKEEQSSLSALMPAKKISLVEDETFHHKPCLVAMEPISDFILLEAYAERRDSDTWNTMLGEVLSGLPVEIIQSTSDEARGIVNHTEQYLGAHHSPDIFHVLQDITKGTSAAMSSKVRSAQDGVDRLAKELERRENRALVDDQRGRPSSLSAKTDIELRDEIRCSEEQLSMLQLKQSVIKDAKKILVQPITLMI